MQKNQFSLAIALLIVSGAASGLVLPEYAEIPVVKAPLDPMKVKPVAIPYIKDEKTKNDLASAFKCATPSAYYLSYNTHPEKAVLIERADEIVARYQRR